MNPFIWETDYPETKQIQEMMKLLDYPIVGNEESDIQFKNDDFAFINVPLSYVIDFQKSFSYVAFDTGEKPWWESYLDTLYFLNNEYIPEEFDDFIPWLKNNKPDFDVEKAFDNGYEEAKHILNTLQGKMEQKLLSNEKEVVDKNVDKREI